jgi:xanthine dehydrogenase YagS FAD-binding subunit
MIPFSYLSPNNLAGALATLPKKWGQTELLAGGTDLLALLKDEIVTPSCLVNIKKISGLGKLECDSKVGLTAGCLVRLNTLATDSRVGKMYPVLCEAIGDAASPQIRNMATIGGNLCQRPRCWYFRNGYGLLALDANGNSLVLNGDNRYHAILGNSGPAYFVSPSTIVPVLVTLGAQVTIAGQAGKRTIPLESFYRIPQKEGEREHDLAPNEIVMQLRIPPISRGARMAYYEVRQKHGFDWPAATATVLLAMKGRKVATACVVLGHVAPVPWRAKEAEAMLVGKKIDEKVADAAAIAALQPARSLGQNGYKIPIARVALRRAILQAAGTPVPPPHPAGANEGECDPLPHHAQQHKNLGPIRPRSFGNDVPQTEQRQSHGQHASLSHPQMPTRMKSLHVLTHAVRFDRTSPDLCPALTWKGQFTPAEHDPTVPSGSDHQYWCVFTQTCVGPDNGLVEPHLCSKQGRRCYKDAVKRLR